jgi:acyl dehydratase
VATRSYAAGVELGPLRKALTQGQIADFEASSATMMERELLRNIHNDPDLALESGLARPIASGMMSVSFLNQLLIDEFGEGWTHGGRLAVSFVRSLHTGDEAVTRAIVTSVESGAEGTRLELEVWCENQDGERVTTGTAALAL